jgi:uncharacterized protein with HEPN domain
MDEQVEKWLYDISLAIEEIENYFVSNEKTFESFQKNTILRRAIERDLEIIGEAVNRILIKQPGIQIRDARKIVGLRNHIIHSYDNVSDENIWAIIIKYLPLLKTDIDKLIAK